MKVEINHPDFPKGTEFDIGGILVPNFSSVDLDDDAVDAFETRNGHHLRDASHPFLKVGSKKVAPEANDDEKDGGE